MAQDILDLEAVHPDAGVCASRQRRQGPSGRVAYPRVFGACLKCMVDWLIAELKGRVGLQSTGKKRISHEVDSYQRL